MPVGYSARCKVCNSPHRADIERLVKVEGISIREAARRLAELGERVSHEAIRRHILEHFDVRAEAREQYLKSKQQMDVLVQKVLSEIEMLDRVMAVEYELHQATGAWLKDLVEKRARLPMAVVALHKETAAELRQTAKAKDELLGNDPMSRLADGVATWTELVQAAADDDDG